MLLIQATDFAGKLLSKQWLDSIAIEPIVVAQVPDDKGMSYSSGMAKFGAEVAIARLGFVAESELKGYSTKTITLHSHA